MFDYRRVCVCLYMFSTLPIHCLSCKCPDTGMYYILYIFTSPNLYVYTSCRTCAWVFHGDIAIYMHIYPWFIYVMTWMYMSMKRWPDRAVSDTQVVEFCPLAVRMNWLMRKKKKVQKKHACFCCSFWNCKQRAKIHGFLKMLFSKSPKKRRRFPRFYLRFVPC